MKTSQATGNGEDNHRGTAAERPSLFGGISPSDYTRISASARVKTFKRGQTLHIEGDSVHQVLLLTSGFVRITKFAQSGTEVILHLSLPGDILGASGLYSTGRHSTTARALRLCRALVWDAPAFKALVECYPVLHQNMVGILGEYLLELEDRFREVTAERVGPEGARQLVRLLKQMGRPFQGPVEIGSFASRLGPVDRHDAVRRKPPALSLGSAPAGTASS